MAVKVSSTLLLALLLSWTHAVRARYPNGDSSATTSFPVTDELTLVTSPDGSYHIDVMNTTWLSSGDTYFRSDRKEYSLSEGSLRSLGTTESQGRDTLGEWRDVTTTWKAGRVLVQTAFRFYVSPPLPAILFKQKYLNDTQRTAVWDPNMVIGSFPSFLDREAAVPLGYLAFGGHMFGDTSKTFGMWGRSLLTMVTGISGGPLVVFDQHGRVVIVSPASQFMSVNNWHDSLLRGSLHWGTMGWVDSVPASHELSVILYYGSGVNQAFQDWGAMMRKMYGRDDTLVKQDLTISHIGYWTDNGAYYYYHTEKNKTYEQTILDVNTYIHKEGIPFKYLQYDSWWYYKGLLNGVANWTSMPQIFPDGMQYVYKQTGLPVSAHNRFWSRDTTYAKQNGGKYNFVIGLLLAVPDDQQFWIDLFTEAKTWGLITYEQDWLDDETYGEGSLMNNLTLGETWLTQMGKGAEVTGLTLQYCMSLSRHALMALKIPQVTQARVSEDYGPGEGQWRIGVSSIFAWALGVAPFKDTFWTTTVQPGNTYHEQEPHTTLQSAVSTLSTGPVGPSDMIGAINISVLMRCCNADGLILKPSRPATAIDAQIIGKAFGTAQGKWGSSEVWSTFSNITGLQFGILLVADLTLPYLDVRPSDMGLSQAERMIFPRGSPHSLTEFSQEHSLRVSNCSTTDFCLFYAPPLITMGSGSRVALLGELDKWVPVSPQRVSSISIANDVTVTLEGVANENIDFLVSKDATLSAIKCVFGASGQATLSINEMTCG